MRLVACAFAAALATAAAPAGAQSVECAPRPSTAVGDWLSAVGADRVATPASTPPVAVLDTGVAAVPELGNRLLKGADMTGGNGTGDDDGHGTAVASVIAAQAGGVRGVSPTTPIIPIKIFASDGSTSPQWVASAITRAVQLGARVVNISAAGPPGQDRAADALVQQAIDAAVTRGAVVVAASGNEGTNRLDIPAAFAHVIAVGATDESNAHASFSNGGSGLNLAAPGENLTVAAPADACPSGYALVSGTSFAAPVVAGAAALLRAAHPNLDPTQLTQLLEFRAQLQPTPPWTPQLGFGLLDLPADLASPVPPADAPEVNDTVAWARRHGPVLTAARRSAVVDGSVTPRIDRADVFGLELKARDRVTIKATSTSALTVSFSDGKRVLAKGATESLRIAKTGSYFVSVTLRAGPQSGARYSLQLRR